MDEIHRLWVGGRILTCEEVANGSWGPPRIKLRDSRARDPSGTRDLGPRSAQLILTRALKRYADQGKPRSATSVNPGIRRCIPTAAAHVPPTDYDTLVQWLRLEKWIHADTSLHPLIRVALGHYQFEALHPFTDGNGRAPTLIGRGQSPGESGGETEGLGINLRAARQAATASLTIAAYAALRSVSWTRRRRGGRATLTSSQ